MGPSYESPEFQRLANRRDGVRGNSGSGFRRQGQNDGQYDQNRGIFLAADQVLVEKRLKNNDTPTINSCKGSPGDASRIRGQELPSLPFTSL